MHCRASERESFRLFGRLFSRVVLPLALLLLCLLSACSSAPLISSKKPSIADSASAAAKSAFASASLLGVKGEYSGALEGYRKLLKSDPSNPAIHFAMAKSFAALGIIDSARSHAEKSVELDPQCTFYLRFLAGISHQMTDYGRAAELYRKLAVLEPGRPEPLSMLAVEYLSAEQPEKALAVFQDILKLDPLNEANKARVVLLEIKLRHYHDAIDTLKGLVGEGEGKDQLRLTLGELYLQTRQYEQAISAIRPVLDENPRFLPAWLALFEVSVQSRNTKAFQADLDRFHSVHEITLKQKADIARLFLARSARDSSYADPSSIMIARICQRYPSSSLGYQLRGLSRLQRKDMSGGVADLQKAILLAPRESSVREDLISARIMQKEFGAAGRAISEARPLFPSKAINFTVLEGELLFQAGASRKAVNLLEKVMTQPATRKEKRLFLQAGTTLALAYDKLGISDKSMRLYEVMLELDPDNSLLMNNLAFMLAEQGTELPRARALSMKAVALDPSNASYIDTFGWILFRMGEYLKAREALEKAAALDPGEAEIRNHLDAVYEKLGMELKPQQSPGGGAPVDKKEGGH
ncbi:MAG: tetratricopeptide repeat protein [Chlorobiaceae bacterium]